MSVDPVFTADWSGARHYWLDMFASRGMVDAPDLRFLEVGCFEGRATLWMLENVLTHPSSMVTVIDTFEAFDGFNATLHSRGTFDTNTAAYQAAGKVEVCQGESKNILRGLDDGGFDFIYIDASHRAPDVLSDAVLSWHLLKNGGVMAFDDYEWGMGKPETESPKIAINAFVSCYARELRIRHCDYQVAVEKL